MSLLAIRDLSIRFGGVEALDGVSFDQHAGEILSLIGPNGAGKTTVFNCMTRVYQPDRGAITFDGHDMLRLPPHRVIKAGVARTFQNIELFGTMSVFDNLLVGLHARLHVTVIESAFRLPRAVREERGAGLRAEEVIRLLGLERYRDAPAAGLPFGVKKRVELGRALMSQPKLLLLDEPANGLSAAEVEDVMRLIRVLRDDLGVTVLMVEHHMGLVMGVSDRVCVLNFGRKISEGTPAQVQRDPAVVEAYLGEVVA